jgi:hypothetical protein
MTSWYSRQSASNLVSVAINRRTVASSSENLARNDRMCARPRLACCNAATIGLAEARRTSGMSAACRYRTPAQRRRRVVTRVGQVLVTLQTLQLGAPSIPWERPQRARGRWLRSGEMLLAITQNLPERNRANAGNAF